jgi:hypothetical protein
MSSGPFHENEADVEAEPVMSHAGTPLDPDLVLFCEPPESIGEVQTAWTTLQYGKQPKPMILRLGVALALTAACPVFAVVVSRAAGLNNIDPAWLIGSSLIVGLVLGGIALAATRFKHVCSYVGTAGMSRHTIKGDVEATPEHEIFLFDDATDLTTAQTRHYTNGVYTGTSYNFDWKDHNGQRVFRLHGSYRSKDGNPKPKDPFHFAQSGEFAWSNYLLDILQEELEQHGSVEFKVNKKDRVRVGPGFLELEFKGKTERVNAEDIQTLQVSGGSFQIKTHDARWLGRKGKFHFDYAAMANARVFLLSLEALAGFHFGDEA